MDSWIKINVRHSQIIKMDNIPLTFSNCASNSKLRFLIHTYILTNMMLYVGIIQINF